jgi:short-chain Z-isoprenyl diphosphate synthase
VNLAVGYGGREEIIDAVAQLIRDRSLLGEAMEEIAGADAAEVEQRLTRPMFLPIPSSGRAEVRPSGFLLGKARTASSLLRCELARLSQG